MNAEFERINAPRIEKILKMLKTIETSAKSNRCTDDLAELLTPVAAAVGGQPAAPQKSIEVVSRPTGRLSISEYVKESSLSDCSMAQAIIATRIDEAMKEAGLI